MRNIRTDDHVEWYLRQRESDSSQIYRTLDEKMFRLLQIRPAYSLGTVECDLVHVDLNSPREYVALSYTWDQRAPSVPILVNGRMVTVSENLYLALVHLRKRGVESLWVDALCINQSDDQERASQVQQMKDIYQGAWVVIVWLGDENRLSEHAFDALHGMVEQMDWRDIVRSGIFDPCRMAQDAEKWRAISHVLHRPWFRRTWVIQEILAARQAFILCGKDLLSMDLFLKIINSILLADGLRRAMSYHHNRCGLSGGTTKAAEKQLRFFVKAKFRKTNWMSSCDFKRTLLNFLAETRWAESTDHRDKVFGLLSLAEDALSLGYPDAGSGWAPFRVDYRLSKEQVFIRTAKAIISTTNSLDVLRFAGKRADGYDGLPSWVPNWANQDPHPVNDFDVITSIGRSESTFWRAYRGDSDPRCRDWWIREQITWRCSPSFTLGSRNRLIIRGIHHDTISSVSTNVLPYIEDVYNSDILSSDHEAENKILNVLERHVKSLHEWIDECTNKATECSPYPTGESASDALWKTLNGHDSGEDPLRSFLPDGHLGYARDARSTFAFIKEKYLSMRRNASDSMSEISLEAAASHLEELFTRFREMAVACWSKRFATTRKKYMGLVPPRARAGDLVCVMYGCETPFILRKRGNNTFQFLGHGSFHGFDFDGAVAESVFRKRQGRVEKSFDFSTFGPSGQRVYTTLKRTRNFTLV